MTLTLPLIDGGQGMVMIDEDVAQVLAAGLRYAVALLDRVDPTQRNTHAAPAGTSVRPRRQGRVEDAARAGCESSFLQHGFQPRGAESGASHSHRASPARHDYQADQLVEDLITLPRREWRGGSNASRRCMVPPTAYSPTVLTMPETLPWMAVYAL